MSRRIGAKEDHTSIAVELNRIVEPGCYQPFDKGVRINELIRATSAAAGYVHYSG